MLNEGVVLLGFLSVESKNKVPKNRPELFDRHEKPVIINTWVSCFIKKGRKCTIRTNL